MLVLLVWNVTLNGPLFEDIEQRLQANTQTIFHVETSEANRQPYLEIMIDQTQHAHVWLKKYRNPPGFSFVTISCICVVFCSVSKNSHIQYLI